MSKMVSFRISDELEKLCRVAADKSGVTFSSWWVTLAEEELHIHGDLLGKLIITKKDVIKTPAQAKQVAEAIAPKPTALPCLSGVTMSMSQARALRNHRADS